MVALLLHLIVPKCQRPVPGKCLAMMEMRWIMEFGVVCSIKASVDDLGMCFPRIRGGYCLQFSKCTSYMNCFVRDPGSPLPFQNMS